MNVVYTITTPGYEGNRQLCANLKGIDKHCVFETVSPAEDIYTFLAGIVGFYKDGTLIIAELRTDAKTIDYVTEQIYENRIPIVVVRDPTVKEAV